MPGTYTYVRCTCGLVFQNPRVVADDVPLLYPADYAPHQPLDEQPVFGVDNGIARLPWLGRFLRETVWLVTIGDLVARRLAPGARWLDVGCGNGSYLARLRKHFDLDLLGVDPASAAIAEARRAGLTVHEGTVHDLELENASCDVVSMWWTLEHVPDPQAEIRRVAELVKPGGTLLVSVPNVASVTARLFGARWHHLDAPRHFTLWTPATLRRLLGEHGLGVERMAFDRAPWGVTGSLGTNATAVKIAAMPFTLAAGLLHVSDTIAAETTLQR